MAGKQLWLCIYTVRTLLIARPFSAYRFSVELSPFRGHTDSVEDLQWSPTEPNVFASCSVDKSIRFWDTRQRKSSALAIPNAHESDVNVISWNKIDSHLLVSGGDEGHIKVRISSRSPFPCTEGRKRAE